MTLLHTWLMEHQLLVRFVKLTAVFLFVTGALGSVVAEGGRTRELLGLRVSPAGFVSTWAVGALYAWVQGRQLFTSWIVLAALLSFGVVSASLALAMRPERPTKPAQLAIMGMLLASVAAMVWKP